MIGTDPGKQLDYVTNSMSFEPYEGALRGPLGTIWAAAGNSTDKALLLAALRKASDPNENARFASCTISTAQAGQLVDSWLSSRAIRPKLPPHPAAVHLDQTQLAQAKYALAAWRALVESTDTQAQALAAQLHSNGIGSQVDVRGALIAATTTHVWLQVQQQGNWVDFDPTIGAAGKQLCAPAQTMVDLPEDWYHHIAINVRVESRSAGAFQSRYAMQTGWRTADLVGSTITFTFAELFGLSQVPPAAAPTGYKAYTPVLAIDHELGVGQPIVLPAAPLGGSHSISGEAASGFGGLGNALNAIGGPATPTPAATASASQIPDVTGVWLSFEIAGPNGYRKTVEEPIFDRIGFAQRAIGHTNDAPLGSLVVDRGEYAALARFWSVTPWVGERYAPLVGADNSTEPYGIAGAFQLLGITGRAYYALRQNIADESKSAGALKVVTTGPSIGVLTSTDSGAAFNRIYDNATVTNVGGSAGSVPSGVLWGVASLEAERSVMLAPAQLAAGHADFSNISGQDVTTVFRLAQSSGASISALGPSDTSKLPAVDASPEARLRLLGELFSGNSVLAPDRAVSIGGVPAYGWWVVAPQTGVIQDEMANGAHDAATEETILEGSSVESISTATRLKKAIGYVYCDLGPTLSIVASLIGTGMVAQQFVNFLRGKWDPQTIGDLIESGVASAMAGSVVGWATSHFSMDLLTGLHCSEGNLVKGESLFDMRRTAPKPKVAMPQGKAAYAPRPARNVKPAPKALSQTQKALSKTRIELPEPSGPTANTMINPVDLPKLDLSPSLTPSQLQAGITESMTGPWATPVQTWGPGGLRLRL